MGVSSVIFLINVEKHINQVLTESIKTIVKLGGGGVDGGGGKVKREGHITE